MLLAAEILFFGICIAALVHSYVAPKFWGWPKINTDRKPDEKIDANYLDGGWFGGGSFGGSGGGFSGGGGSFGGGGAAGGW